MIYIGWYLKRKDKVKMRLLLKFIVSNMGLETGLLLYRQQQLQLQSKGSILNIRTSKILKKKALKKYIYFFIILILKCEKCFHIAIYYTKHVLLYSYVLDINNILCMVTVIYVFMYTYKKMYMHK